MKHHQIEADWIGALYDLEPDSGLWELAHEDWQLVRHIAEQDLWVVATRGDGNTLKLYKVEALVPRFSLLHVEELGEQSCKWIHLDLSPDGNVIAAAFGVFAVAGEGNWRKPSPGFLTYLAVHGDRLTFRAEDLGFSLAYQWENETEQFFAVLHPDNRHGFFWTYGKSRLAIVDIHTGEVTASKGIEGVGALNVSENGGLLLLSNSSSSLRAFRLPDLKPVIELYHGYGYDWTPIGIAMNASEDLAMAFTGHSRHLPVDIQCQVTDWDSHLVMWKKDEHGNWEDIDALHFLQMEHSIDAFGTIAMRAAGNQLHWAGQVKANEIMWMELPSLRKSTIPVEDAVNDLYFSMDGSKLYFIDWMDQVHVVTVPITPGAELVEVQQLEYPRQTLISPPSPVSDWRQFWDAGKARLDLTGTAIRSLDFLKEIPEIETLILDGSDVLALPDMSAMTRLRRLSCKRCLVQDFRPLAGLDLLEELCVKGCSVPNLEWVRGMTGLRKLDLARSTVTAIDALAGLPNLEWLSLAETFVTDIGPLLGLPLRHLDLTRAHILDLEPVRATATLETLIVNGGVSTPIVASPAWNSLRRLELQNSLIEEASLTHLVHVEWLDVSRTDLHDFSFLAALRKLKYLDLSRTAFVDLATLLHCQSLESLNIRYTHIRNGLDGLPGKQLKALRLNADSFADLAPLRRCTGLELLEVKMSECWEVMGEVIEGMPLLEELRIEGVSKASHARSLAFLHPLKRLKRLNVYVDVIADLQPVAGITSLEDLHISATQILRTAPLGSLKALKRISIGRLHCYGNERGSLPSIFDGLPNVQYFEAPMACFDSVDFLEGYTQIRELNLQGLGERGQGFLKNMVDLQALQLDANMVDPLPLLPALRKLQGIDLQRGEAWPRVPRLRKVSLDSAKPALLQAFWSLRELTVDGRETNDFQGFPKIPSLRRMVAYRFSGAGLAELAKFTGLEELCIHDSILDAFPDLSGLPCLRTLRLKNVTVLDPSGLGTLRHLHTLEVEEIVVPDYDWLGTLEELRDLDLSDDPYSRAKAGAPLSGLWALRKLQRLHLRTTRVKSIPDWGFMGNVQDAWLDIRDLESLPEIAVGLPNLRKLRLTCRGTVDFSFLAHCKGLRELAIACEGFQQLGLLSGATNLREIDVRGTSVDSLLPIASLKGLRKIDFSRTKVKRLNPLAGLRDLERIDFEGVKVPTFAPLGDLDCLEWINGDLPADQDISLLAEKTHLKTIMLGRGKIKTLQPLFPILLSGQIEHLSMLDTTVTSLPKGLKFDRYDFIKNLKAYWATRPGKP